MSLGNCIPEEVTQPGTHILQPPRLLVSKGLGSCLTQACGLDPTLNICSAQPICNHSLMGFLAGTCTPSMSSWKADCCLMLFFFPLNKLTVQLGRLYFYYFCHILFCILRSLRSIYYYFCCFILLL